MHAEPRPVACPPMATVDSPSSSDELLGYLGRWRGGRGSITDTGTAGPCCAKTCGEACRRETRGGETCRGRPRRGETCRWETYCGAAVGTDGGGCTLCRWEGVDH